MKAICEMWMEYEEKGIFLKPDINSPDISPPDLCADIWTEEESKKSNFQQIFHFDIICSTRPSALVNGKILSTLEV